jgi:hypothetical protein
MMDSAVEDDTIALDFRNARAGVRDILGSRALSTAFSSLRLAAFPRNTAMSWSFARPTGLHSRKSAGGAGDRPRPFESSSPVF